MSLDSKVANSSSDSESGSRTGGGSTMVFLFFGGDSPSEIKSNQEMRRNEIGGQKKDKE